MEAALRYPEVFGVPSAAFRNFDWENLFKSDDQWTFTDRIRGDEPVSSIFLTRRSDLRGYPKRYIATSVTKK